MATTKHLRTSVNCVLHRGGTHRRDDDALMVLVDFDELQLLSGSRQISKVCRFLDENSIPYVIGSDGKPRTTNDMLNEGIRNAKEDDATEVRFSS